MFINFTFPGPSPTFLTCPSNREALSNTNEKQIWWEDPKAVDYEGQQIANLESNHIPGSRFTLGLTTVVYIARDRFGGSSTCVFNITVLSQGNDLRMTFIIHFLSAYAHH